jgi:hypothetical protein
MAFHTEAGRKFSDANTKWLQDTRLMSEAIHRLYKDYQQSGRVDFSRPSWPKPPKGELPLAEFKIHPVPLGQRMEDLLKSLWSAQFVFLESLWEEYLQDLVLELRSRDPSVFEPFCEQKFMALVVRDVLSDKLGSLEEIKDEAAARFAAGITRQPWADQWKQLSRLNIGLTNAQESESWFKNLDIYFEIRNCLIHRGARVSSLLKQKSEYYAQRNSDLIAIWPQHLDFYRGQFMACITLIEGKIKATGKKGKG